jgi:hypothetical protein
MYALKAFIIDGDVEMKMVMIFEPKAPTAKKTFLSVIRLSHVIKEYFTHFEDKLRHTNGCT